MLAEQPYRGYIFSLFALSYLRSLHDAEVDGSGYCYIDAENASLPFIIDTNPRSRQVNVDLVALGPKHPWRPANSHSLRLSFSVPSLRKSHFFQNSKHPACATGPERTPSLCLNYQPHQNRILQGPLQPAQLQLRQRRQHRLLALLQPPYCHSRRFLLSRSSTSLRACR